MKPARPTKAPWEIAIERLAKTVAEADKRAEARAEQAAAEAKARAEQAEARAAEADKRAEARAAEFAAEAKARAEEAKARAAEADKRMAEADKRLTVIEKGLKLMTAESGDRANDRGFAFERAVYATLKTAKDLCGITLDGGIRFNVYDHNGFQYDMVALNGKKTIVVETKITLDLEDVEHFAEFRLPFFINGGLPEYTKGKEVIGAMIYQRTDHGGKAVKAALARGLLVVAVDNKKHLHQITKATDIIERKRRPRKK